MPISSKIFQTSTFRLAALYFSIFALSTLAILGYIFWNTARLLERQTDETIKAEVLGLSDQYRLLGVPGVAELMRRRNQEDSTTLYALVDSNGVHIAGNLKSLPPEKFDVEGWVDFPIKITRAGRSVEHVARGYHADLANGYEVMVARDVEDVRLFSTLISNALYFALGFALLFGLGGGLLTSRNFLRRVDAITGASRTIMNGDLTSRMPVTGSGDELDRLSASLNEMLDQIERLMLGMKEVSSNVAHDLKTPLTRLRARVDAALRSDNPAEYRAALTTTIEESDRLLQTFNALLSIARAEAGQLGEGLQTIDLREVVADVVDLYEPVVEDAGGTLAFVDGEPIAVRADRQLIAQAVSNLIDNAIKYGEGASGLQIGITGEIKGEKVELAVSDRGEGIAEPDRARVTDRFVRLDASRTKPGNGLGLALVASIMKLHGGQVVFEDNAPGLRAKLVLPALRQPS